MMVGSSEGESVSPGSLVDFGDSTSSGEPTSSGESINWGESTGSGELASVGESTCSGELANTGESIDFGDSTSSTSFPALDVRSFGSLTRFLASLIRTGSSEIGESVIIPLSWSLVSRLSSLLS